MAIALVNITSAETAWGTSVVVDKPTDTAEGHAMIAVIGFEKEAESINSIPSGWTAFTDFPYTVGSSGVLAVYHKIAGASEPATYTWGITGSSSILGSISAWSGADTSDPFGNEGYTAQTDWSDDLDAPSITIQSAGNVALHISFTDASSTSTPPGGTPTYTEILDIESGCYVGMSWATYSSTGATGIKTATLSTSRPRIGVHIELLIAAAGTTSPTSIFYGPLVGPFGGSI